MLAVEAFKADVDVGDCRREMSKNGAHCDVRFGLGFRIGAVPFSKVWDGTDNGVEVGVFPDDVPSALENKSSDPG